MKNLLLFLWVFPPMLFAQTHLKFIGEIYSRADSSLLKYANVSVLNTPIGTISNEDGHFQLTIPAPQLDRDLVISHIGFQDFRIPLKKIKSPTKIYLNPQDYALPTAVVFPPDKIVKKAIEQIGYNYLNESYYAHAYFRKTIKYEKEYRRLVEAAGDILSDGYQKSAYHTGTGNTIYLNHIRKSFDTHRPLKYNAWYILLSTDLVKRRSMFLNPDNLDHFSFELVGTQQWQGQLVYFIQFKSKNSWSGDPVEGALYIDTESYAFHLVKYGFRIDQATESPLTNRQWNHRRAELRYKLFNGRYFLAYAEREHLMDDQDGLGLGLFYSQMLVNQISYKEQFYHQVNPRHKISRKRDIYLAQRGYNAWFWRNFNFIIPSKEYQAIIATLENQLR